MWISDAIGNDRIQPSRAAHHSGGPDAARSWLEDHYYDIPESLRPAKSDLNEFAAFFSTYLISSFDVVERPGTRGEGPLSRFGCRCELCLRIVAAPHLQAKKLFARDKKRATTLMERAVMKLAKERGTGVTEAIARDVATNEGTRRDAAYVAYGEWLIRRLSGESDGPAVLALWRLIAWDPRGGMQRDFELLVDDFRAAEKSVLNMVAELADGFSGNV